MWVGVGFAILGFILGGLIAIWLHNVIIFLIGAAIGILVAAYFFPDNDVACAVLAVLFGIGFSILFNLVLSLLTAIQGGTLVFLGIMVLGGGPVLAVITGIVVGCIGLFFQLFGFPFLKIEPTAELRKRKAEAPSKTEAPSYMRPEEPTPRDNIRIEQLRHELAEDDQNVKKHLELAELVRPRTKGESPGEEREAFKEAELHYKKVIDLQPDNAEAHFGLGSLYSLHGRTEYAIKELRVVVELEPFNLDADLELARLLSRSDDKEQLKESAGIYTRILKAGVFDESVTFEKAEVLRRLDDIEGYTKTCRTFFPSFDPELHEIRVFSVPEVGSGWEVIDRASGHMIDRKYFGED